MTVREETTSETVTSMWQTAPQGVQLDEDCSPTKVCRNMTHVTFDGYGDEGDDPTEAWRTRLAREGKLDGSASSLADLVFGETRP